MVALLVVLTIVGCLVVDGIVVAMRERRAVAVSGHRVPEMVFAQDGGEPIDEEQTKAAKADQTEPSDEQ